MLFKLDKEDVFKSNPELLALPEFAQLTDRQLRYVILSTDYKSPFRRLSLDNKKYQAAVTAGYKLEKDGKRLDMNGRNLVGGKVMAVEYATKKYKELQRDEDYETLQSVNTLISQIREVNAKPEKSILELEKAVALTVGKLDKLMETKKKLEELLDFREEETLLSDQTQEAITGEDLIEEGSLSILAQVNQGLI